MLRCAGGRGADYRNPDGARMQMGFTASNLDLISINRIFR